MLELPLPAGMKPLEELARERQPDPLQVPSPPPTPRVVMPAAEPKAADPFAFDTADLPSLDTPSLDTPSLDTPSLDTPSLDTPSLDTPSLELELEPVERPRRRVARPSASPEPVDPPAVEPPWATPWTKAREWLRGHPRLVIGGALLLVLALVFSERTERWEEGVRIDDEPVQEPLEDPRVSAFGGYELIPKATYRLRARILGRERYRLGRESELSSYDLALGWGVMSDQRVLDALDIRQGTRRYRYSWDGDEPAHPSAMARQSANHHIIAGSTEVNEVIEDTPVGGALELEGELVVVEAPDGWRWSTSLTRLDVGDGACEIFLVHRARRLDADELRAGID